MWLPSGRRTLGPLLLAAGLAWLSAEPPARAVPAGVERVAVESSSLLSIGYDQKARTLEIEFRSGARYRYLAVPATVFEELKKAPSKGRYFAQSIRGRYEFQRLRAAAP